MKQSKMGSDREKSARNESIFFEKKERVVEFEGVLLTDTVYIRKHGSKMEISIVFVLKKKEWNS